MKLKLCKVDHDEVDYYVEESKKLGYIPFIDRDENREKWICINVLNYKSYWNNPNNEYTNYGGKIVIFNFKENIE